MVPPPTTSNANGAYASNPKPRRATVADLDDRQLWVRILNRAQASGLSAAAVQKTGQICRSLISWFQDADLLTRNPMRGVRYSMTRGDNDAATLSPSLQRRSRTWTWSTSSPGTWH